VYSATVFVTASVEPAGMVPRSSSSGYPTIRRDEMGRKLYVGNLPYSIDEQMLETAFAACGDVDSVKIIIDRDTGRSKGFGFVEMSRDSEAQKAIQDLNGTSMDGRDIAVNEARPMEPRNGGGGGGGGRY
jgi:cold-inducible RNA-binding protein